VKSAASGDGGCGNRVTFAGWKAILADEPDDPELSPSPDHHRIKDAFGSCRDW